MIITRTPFRITLGGGGTDLPSYYEKHGGFICAASIDKYMFVNVNRTILDEQVRVKYTKSEEVAHRDQVKHDIAREAMRLCGFEKALEIISNADVPAGTGLGSSSCYTVGLLNALHTLNRDHISLDDLAEEACRLEIDILKNPIGKQDQYMAVFGGLTVLEIDKSGKVSVRNVKVDEDVSDDLSRNLLAFYTGCKRDANDILQEQSDGAKANQDNVVESMHKIKEIGYKILEAIESGNLTDVGLCFDEHWEYKKKISTKMSNPEFNEIYEKAKAAGALGGKISGAGGGGFFVFYVEENHGKFREKMQALGLIEMRFRFDKEGSKVLVNV